MNIATGRQIGSIEAFALLLLVIFTTELAVMEIFTPLFSRLSVLQAAFIDATLLVVFTSLPLWFLFSPAFGGWLNHDGGARRAQSVAFVQLAAAFFLFELAVMIFLPGVLRGIDPLLFGLADAGLTALLTAPLLWWLLKLLERAHHRVVLVDLVESPLRLYLLLLYVVFLADLLESLLVPGDAASSNHLGTSHVVDAMVLTLIVSPFLWLFVARPLRRSVQTEQKRAKAIYEQVIDAVILADSHGRITALNPAAQQIFGYAEVEVVGRPLRTLVADEQRSLEPLIDSVTDNVPGSSWVSREIYMRHRYGGTRLMDVTISQISLAGREDYLLIMRDISERKDAEIALRESDSRFREIYEQSEDAILFLKPGTTYVVDANATVELLFGYSKSEMRCNGIACLFQGKELAWVQQAIGTLQEGKIVQLDQLQSRRHDGTECIVSLRAKFMTLQGVQMVYCTLRDVTERMRLEQESRDIQLRLLHANKMTSLGLLVSGVAHEVNNPNNLIMTNAQLLAGGLDDAVSVLRKHYQKNGDFLVGGIPFSELDEQLPHLLTGIIDGSQRISRIVDKLKNYSRIDPSGYDASVDINQVATASVAMVQYELARATTRFHCDLASELPLIVGNSQQLGQVVINLLINACQALPSRQHGIRLTTVFNPQENQVVLTVADEGIGITPELGRKIMEPFFTTRLDSGGTGLGLSICRSIVTEHRGILEFSSTPGEGTTFTVKIPVDAEAAKDMAYAGV
jgi:PAS domain S-box-containing protein